MSSLSLQLPDSSGLEYLEERGRRGNPKLVDPIRSRVPDVPPSTGDEAPGET
jgi:hypothetical protein